MAFQRASPINSFRAFASDVETFARASQLHDTLPDRKAILSQSDRRIHLHNSLHIPGKQ